MNNKETASELAKLICSGQSLEIIITSIEQRIKLVIEEALNNLRPDKK